MTIELTDAQLVERCRSGDQEAWNELVERFSRYVYAIAVRGFRLPETDAEDVIREMTAWRGADVVVDAVGHESALTSTFSLVRQGGTISLAGMYVEDQAPVPIGDMWLKTISIVCGVANIQGHMDELLELVRDGRLDPKAIISHRLPLSQAAEGYELFDSKEALKVVLDPKA